MRPLRYLPEITSNGQAHCYMNDRGWLETDTVTAGARRAPGSIEERKSRLHARSRNSLGSHFAEVHNGSSLFTGDAGQGESNIRRWIIENDWLEAIVALPLNLFYSTGIATYVWVLTNRKSEQRRGKVQLIDATGWNQALRKNRGRKNCELGEDDIARVCDTSLAFEETEHSRIFDNADFGYWRVTVERPLRIKGVDPDRVYKASEIKKLRETGERNEDAPAIIRKVHKQGTEADPLKGLFPATIKNRPVVVEYEPDTALRDTEQVPLTEGEGLKRFSDARCCRMPPTPGTGPTA